MTFKLNSIDIRKLVKLTQTGSSYWWLLAASLVTLTGDVLRRLAIALWLYKATSGNGLEMALATVFDVGPSLLCGLVAGVLVDRVDRRRLMIWSDLLRGCVSVTMMLAIAKGNLFFVYGLIGMAAVLGSPYGAAKGSILSQIVPNAERQQANSLMVITAQITFVMGAAFGAFLYGRFGVEFLLAFDAVSYGLSAALTTQIRLAAINEAKRSAERFITEFKEGVSYLIRNRIVLGVAVTSLLLYGSAGLNNTAMIFFLNKVLHHPPVDIAWLSGTNGVAQILTAIGVIRIGTSTNVQNTLMYGLGLEALGGLIVAGAMSLPMLLTGVIITSFGNSPVNIAMSTVQQKYVPVSYFGRVSSVLDTTGTSVFLATSTISGLMVNLIGSRGVLIVSEALHVIAIILAYLQIFRTMQMNAKTELEVTPSNM